MSQCFQDVGLTEWTNIVGKQCPNKMHCTKENLDECIRDYLEGVVKFPNIGDQLIRWLHTAKKTTFMPMHAFMWRQVQLLSYLDGSYICQTMELPTTQEKSKTNLLCAAQGTLVQVCRNKQDCAHRPASAHSLF
jgi:hypothetical protein